MEVLLIILGLLASTHCTSSNVRVVGGTVAPPGAYPYQVSLRQLITNHFCGGSILNEHFILTAAHCVTNHLPLTIRVVAGTNKLNEKGTDYRVKKIIVHENYDPVTIKNDIALIRTESPIVFNDIIQSIALPKIDSNEGDEVVLTGWGRTSYPGDVSNDLQQLNLTVVDNRICEEKHGNGITETNVCTFTKNGEGACHGDSGGPLLDIKQKAIIGIVSWGEPCAIGYPDVFTRVYSYLDWINKKLQY